MHAHTTTYHEIQYKDRPIYVVYSRLNQNLLIKYTIYIVYTILCKPVINYLEDLNIFLYTDSMLNLQISSRLHKVIEI